MTGKRNELKERTGVGSKRSGSTKHANAKLVAGDSKEEGGGRWGGKSPDSIAM